jgi:hypothetical protein
MNTQENRFSLFQSFRNAHSRKTISLAEFTELVRGEKYRREIESIRKSLARGDKKSADRQKLMLPAVTPSGVFSYRKIGQPFTHSGLLCLDFDHCGCNAKTGLSCDKYTALAFVSPGGQGLKVFVRVDPDRHAQSFDFAQHYYREQYDLDADRQCSDVTRLCFASYDPELVFRPDADLLPFDETPQEVTLPSDNPVITQCKPSDTPVRSQCKPNDNTVQSCAPAGGDREILFSIEELIQRTIPKKAGRRNNQAMWFARGLRFNCGLPALTPGNLKKYARQWYAAAEPHIGTKNFDETFGDIVQGYKNATKPLDAPSTKISVAWEKVCSGEVHTPESDEFEDERIKNLVNLCFALRDKKDEFFLSGKKAGALIGVSHSQAHQWLVKLLNTQFGIIEKISTGNTHAANDYRWKGAQ